MAFSQQVLPEPTHNVVPRHDTQLWSLRQRVTSQPRASQLPFSHVSSSPHVWPPQPVWHAPLTHDPVGSQALSQRPQFKVFESTQPLPQQSEPLGHVDAHVHSPPMQLAPGWQAIE